MGARSPENDGPVHAASSMLPYVSKADDRPLDKLSRSYDTIKFVYKYTNAVIIQYYSISFSDFHQS